MIQYPRYRQHRFSSFQVIIAGFAAVDLVGALLLMLPIAAQQRCVTPFHEALFTSTSALCVTGLVVQDTGSYLRWDWRCTFLWQPCCSRKQFCREDGSMRKKGWTQKSRSPDFSACLCTHLWCCWCRTRAFHRTHRQT